MKISITIESVKISTDIENKIVKLINIHGFYGKLDNNMIHDILKFLKKNFKNIKEGIILSVRSAYIIDKIIFNHDKLKRNSLELYNEYLKNKDVIKISKKYDFSPMSIIRQFLLIMGYSKKNIKSILKDPKLISDKNLGEQIEFINNNDLDIFAKVNQDVQHDLSENFELEISDFLRVHKVKFLTQDELSLDQIKEFGKAINTPDFLIKSELYINGFRVYWIDAKNFYGANTWLIKYSINKQIKKYIDKWGPGCIIFKDGLSENLKFPKTILVNI